MKIVLTQAQYNLLIEVIKGTSSCCTLLSSKEDEVCVEMQEKDIEDAIDWLVYELDIEGFDANDELTPKGKILEPLIDILEYMMLTIDNQLYMVDSVEELIHHLILLSKKTEAVLLLSLEDSWDSDAISCQIDKGKYLLLYYTTDLDNPTEKYPRSYHRGLETHKKVEIRGNFYDENTICYDYGLVLMLFKEFFQQKQIPLYILS